MAEPAATQYPSNHLVKYQDFSPGLKGAVSFEACLALNCPGFKLIPKVGQTSKVSWKNTKPSSGLSSSRAFWQGNPRLRLSDIPSKDLDFRFVVDSGQGSSRLWLIALIDGPSYPSTGAKAPNSAKTPFSSTFTLSKVPPDQRLYARAASKSIAIDQFLYQTGSRPIRGRALPPMGQPFKSVN